MSLYGSRSYDESMLGLSIPCCHMRASNLHEIDVVGAKVHGTAMPLANGKYAKELSCIHVPQTDCNAA